MGKPFSIELRHLEEIFNWSLVLPTFEFENFIKNAKRYPLITVGSGGSLSACYFTNLLHQSIGIISKTFTPLELFYNENILKRSNFLLISAGGRNPDIISAFKKLVNNEPYNILNIIMRKGSQLGKISSKYSIAKTLEFDIPTKKDGFLATNSLLAYFTYIANSYAKLLNTRIDSNIKIDNKFHFDLNSFLPAINRTNTFSILYGGWGYPVAVDIESKLTESALGNAQISDLRNFGHGRHHWFAKKGDDSAIILLITKDEEDLAQKTMNLLPKNIPKFIIKTKKIGFNATLELLVKSFYFIDMIGKARKIDPGKPGVPSYGSKLYRLNFYSFYKRSRISLGESDKYFYIKRKFSNNVYNHFERNKQIPALLESQEIFLRELQTNKFKGIIFDYDGTLNSTEDRYNDLNDEIKNKIALLLKNRIVIGISTGRGKSVRDIFQNSFAKKYWNLIFVGYYNSSDIAPLKSLSNPNSGLNYNEDVLSIKKSLEKSHYNDIVNLNIRPNQLSIDFKQSLYYSIMKDELIEYIYSLNIKNIKILESSHSIDVFSTIFSKLDILNYISLATNNIVNKNNVLCIGDRGNWPGNDYQLLSSKYSLSVDEVSPNPNSCWNVSPKGIRGIHSTLYYLDNLILNNGYFTIKLK